LDEPTTGLDPASRRDLWREVKRLNQTLGMTIFLTTQYLEEADELADVVAIINRGRIVTEGLPAMLKAAVGKESINLAFENQSVAEAAANQLAGLAESVQIDRAVVRLYLEQAAGSIPTVINRLQEQDINPVSLTLTQPTLDDVFLQATGQSLVTQETEAAVAA
jgi:ABC-2 type transport system ATP-binding protein